MAKKNSLTQVPPYAVERSSKQLGANLRTARLRRNLTIEEVAQKIGTGPRAVANAEQGKITTGVAVYFALLWAYDLLGQVEDIADPARDREGLRLASRRQRARAEMSEELDNDF